MLGPTSDLSVKKVRAQAKGLDPKNQLLLIGAFEFTQDLVATGNG